METADQIGVSRALSGGSGGYAGVDHNRRAKIVATLGPSCSSPEVFRELVRAGVDVARLNFSHGTHAQKGELIRMVRAVSAEMGKPICILADLQGPKIRTGKAEEPCSGAVGGGPSPDHYAARCGGIGLGGGHHLPDAGGEPGAALAHTPLRWTN